MDSASITLRGSKVDNIAILLEHVDLLDGLNWLDIQLLKRSLQLLVIAARGLLNLLDLSSWGTLSTNKA